jgi:hypothetical protein
VLGVKWGERKRKFEELFFEECGKSPILIFMAFYPMCDIYGQEYHLWL